MKKIATSLLKEVLPYALRFVLFACFSFALVQQQTTDVASAIATTILAICFAAFIVSYFVADGIELLFISAYRWLSARFSLPAEKPLVQ